MNQCRSCIYWDSEHSWIDEIPLHLQFVADCTECRMAHCRRHCPNTYIVPEPNSPRGFRILSLFPVTVVDGMCGDYVEGVDRVRSKAR